jgi:hypothetical protein
MNKRIYYKKLNKFISENIDKKLYGKIVYHDVCKNCEYKDPNCRMDCDGMPRYFNFQFYNKEFDKFMTNALGNTIDFDISEKRINNKLMHYVLRDKNKYLKIVYSEDYITVKNKFRISPFDYEKELVGVFEIKDRGWKL